jgi:hypothetical protein
MNAAKKIETISIEEFEARYFNTRCEFHNGVVTGEETPGERKQAQAAPDHSFIQFCFGQTLGPLFNKKSGSKPPGGWWLFDECPVRYGDKYLFLHDLGGWKRARVPERPRRYPITEKPDWICEILSTNHSTDRHTKRAVLHEYEVPYYWIVDPVGRLIEVYEWAQKGYVLLMTLDETFKGKIPPFDSAELKVSHLFGDEDD